MTKRMISIAVAIILCGVLSNAVAEKATELYIPIGKSPGLSGKYTVMGKIEQVNYQMQTLTMSNAAGSYDIKVTDRTMIFLDKSKMNQQNEYGTLEDCKKGMTAEIKFEDNEKGRPAAWIKLQEGQ
jgi:hypothetical protein